MAVSSSLSERALLADEIRKMVRKILNKPKIQLPRLQDYNTDTLMVLHEAFTEALKQIENK